MDEKLYVLVREDLPVAQQAVQAGHAVAEYLLRGPSSSWPNGTLVYLSVPDEERLNRWGVNLDFLGVPFVVFKEPDIGNEVTALAAVTNDERVFRSLQLAMSA
jgi:hypothetical protein